MTASWGSAESALAKVSVPALSQPLSGDETVNVKVTHILPQSTGLTVGEAWSDDWTFDGSCSGSSCTISDHGSLIEDVAPFTAKLTPSGGSYVGSASHVQFSHCDGQDSYVTVELNLKPNDGGVTGGDWNSWHGTMTLTTPAQNVAGGTCDGGDWVMNLGSSGN